MVESVKVGIIQTSLNREIAFKDGPLFNDLEGDRVWNEIKKAFSSFQNESKKPNFIVIPELSVPTKYIHNLEKISIALNCVTLAGVEYKIDRNLNSIKNQVIMIVPSNWDKNTPSRRANSYYFGKSYFAPKEKEELEKLGYKISTNPNFYLIDTNDFGTFGVAICYDFLDLQRLLLYQAEVQHYFILAYNKDINTFSNIAETVARTVFCNVVVCNTGHYGGSMAISPYYDPHKRTIFKTEGNNLFTTQIIDLPLIKLYDHQKEKNASSIGKPLFKSLPPGYSNRIEFKLRRKSI